MATTQKRNGVFIKTVMKYFLLIISLLFAYNFCFAQQKIVFEKIDDNFKDHLKKIYTLPKSVTCTFKNGTKQRLVLENVKGDSLIFRKYYNQKQSFDCVFSSLNAIKIYNKNEKVLYVLFNGFVVTTVSFIAAAIYNNHPPTDAGDPSLSYANLFSMATIFPITGAIITAAYFPKNYNFNKWKLYAK